jgi:hypothetical protein
LATQLDFTLGNTDALKAAQRALTDVARGVIVKGKTADQVSHALCKALLIFLEVCETLLQLTCTMSFSMFLSRYVLEATIRDYNNIGTSHIHMSYALCSIVDHLRLAGCIADFAGAYAT